MRMIFVTFVTLLMTSAALAQTPAPVTPPACEQAQAVQSQQFISVPVYGYVAPVVYTPTVTTPVFAAPVYATPVVVRPRLFRPFITGVVVGPVIVRPVVVVPVIVVPVIVRPVIVRPVPTILPLRAWTAFW